MRLASANVCFEAPLPVVLFMGFRDPAVLLRET